MRFATIRSTEGTTAARLDGDMLVPLDAADVGALLVGPPPGDGGGVGNARKPPVYLQPGQTLRTVIEGIGECVNLCVPDKA